MISDYDKEMIKEIYCFKGFPSRSVDIFICRFHQRLIDKQTKQELTIADFLFAETNKFILVEISFCIRMRKL